MDASYALAIVGHVTSQGTNVQKMVKYRTVPAKLAHTAPVKALGDP